MRVGCSMFIILIGTTGADLEKKVSTGQVTELARIWLIEDVERNHSPVIFRRFEIDGLGGCLGTISKKYCSV